MVVSKRNQLGLQGGLDAWGSASAGLSAKPHRAQVLSAWTSSAWLRRGPIGRGTSRRPWATWFKEDWASLIS